MEGLDGVAGQSVSRLQVGEREFKFMSEVFPEDSLIPTTVLGGEWLESGGAPFLDLDPGRRPSCVCVSGSL